MHGQLKRSYVFLSRWLINCVICAVTLIAISPVHLLAASGTADDPFARNRSSITSAAVAMTTAMTTAKGSMRPTSAPETAVYYQLVARHSNRCLDVGGASVDDYAQVVQWDCNSGSFNQQWRLESTSDGYFRILARHSGKALDVNGGSLDDLATVIQYSLHGGANQQWRLDAVGDNYYQIVARHSGKALDVLGGSLDNGASVIQYSPHTNPNQQWMLRAISSSTPTPTPTPSPTPTPIPSPTPTPTPTGVSGDTVRFLEQATFGVTPELGARVQSIGFDNYLNEQFNAAASSYPTMPLYPTTRDTVNCPNNSACQRDNYSLYLLQNRFFTNALYGEDQVRQRVAFALHQIFVVSGVEITQPSWMAPYLQILDRNALGNFRQLLFDITVNPAMGNYLDMAGNSRINPNENYAREVLQLFSIGTVKLNSDGTPQLDANGQAIPAYTQTTVNNFARVFTGWRFAPAPASGVPNYIDPMVVNESQHDTATKTLLNGKVLPAGQTTLKDLNDALDNIFNDPNVAPFISKQLIQHLVTSNPSPGYVRRVASAFNDNGAGVRGDMKAVVRAILLDEEARGNLKSEPNYGRLRHPAQFVCNILRLFNAQSANRTTASDGYLNPQTSGMGMDVFRPPSVFSYYSPGTVVAGTNGVRGPEFGILSTSTALRRANFVNSIVFGNIAVSTNAPNGTSIDLSGLQTIASNPTQLVNKLDELMMHGTMSAEMRNSIVSAVSAVAESNSLKRARTAVYLVATSSQYQVEK